MDLWEVVFNKFSRKFPAPEKGPKSAGIGAKAPTMEVEREVPLLIYEDNQATIQVLEKGTSKAVGHMQRTHRVNIHWLSEVVRMTYIHLFYLETLLQVADIFTKAFLDPVKWAHACSLIGMGPKAPVRSHLGANQTSQKKASTLAIRPTSNMSSWQQDSTGRPQIGGQPPTPTTGGLIGAQAPTPYSNSAGPSWQQPPIGGKPPTPMSGWGYRTEK